MSLGNHYLSDFRTDDQKPPQYPIDVIMCDYCSLVQLTTTTPPEAMYHDRYGYYSGVNQTMKDHLKGIYENAMQAVTLNTNDIIVDIGSNDGTLLKNYPETVRRVGFDPVSKFAPCYKDTGITFVNDYFNRGSYPFKEKAKIITAISMFYDLENPNEFVADLKSLLAPNGIIIIQQNYLASMLEQNAVDNICHEHLEFYSLTSLRNLLKRHNLSIVDASENDLNGGSFRVIVQHKNPQRPGAISVMVLEDKEDAMRLQKPDPYRDFATRIEKLKDQIRSFIQVAKDQGKTIYLYGASTRGNTLLQYCELDVSLITAAVERNPEKWGTKIASVGIPIISEEQARKEKPDYMLVLPWFFKKEFIKREKDYIERGGALIFPLPEFHVVNKDNYTDSLG